MLGTLLSLSSSVLYIPVMYNSMHVYTCKVTWLDTGLACYTGLHLTIALILPVILALYFSLIAAGALRPHPTVCVSARVCVCLRLVCHTGCVWLCCAYSTVVI